MSTAFRDYMLDFSHSSMNDENFGNIQQQQEENDITSPSLLILKRSNASASPLNKSLGRSLTVPHQQKLNSSFTNKSANSSCYGSPTRGRILHQETQEVSGFVAPHLIISPQRNSNSNSTENCKKSDEHQHQQQHDEEKYFNPEDMLISPTYIRRPPSTKKSLDDLLAADDDDFEIQLRPDDDDDDEKHNIKDVSASRYFDDDFNLLEDDGTAEELQRLRDVADERQQRIFDLQAELAEAKDNEDELQGTVEMLRSELRSVRSAMTDANSFHSPAGSAAHFASPSALRELQMQLLRSGNNINLLGSPSAHSQCCCGSAICSNSQRRSEQRQHQTNEMGTSTMDDEFVLEQSMRTVNKKLVVEADDDDQCEDDVDDYSQQISGTFLLPPKAILMAHRRQLLTKKNIAKNCSSLTAAAIALQEQLLEATVNSADLKRGGKINLKKLAKFAANANMEKSRFSFKFFLFDIVKF